MEKYPNIMKNVRREVVDDAISTVFAVSNLPKNDISKMTIAMKLQKSYQMARQRTGKAIPVNQIPLYRVAQGLQEFSNAVSLADFVNKTGVPYSTVVQLLTNPDLKLRVPFEMNIRRYNKSKNGDGPSNLQSENEVSATEEKAKEVTLHDIVEELTAVKDCLRIQEEAMHEQNLIIEDQKIELIDLRKIMYEMKIILNETMTHTHDENGQPGNFVKLKTL
jgi:hypothetical protein